MSQFSSSKSKFSNSQYHSIGTSKYSDQDKITFQRSDTYIVENPSCYLKQDNNHSRNFEEKSNPHKTSISTIKQQKRTEMKRTKDQPNSFKVSGNQKSIEFLIKSAKTSGQINISNYNLVEVPNDIWNINIDNQANHDDKNEISFENKGYKWWDQVELTKLIIASNKLRIIPDDIQKLANLILLDIHDNHIDQIDDAIGNVVDLKILNCSHNQLSKLPNGLCKLKKLVEINVSYNKLTELPKDFGYLDNLEDVNLSNNRLEILPKSFEWFRRVKKLNLAANSLKLIEPEIFFSISLIFIDLSENQIQELPQELNELNNLEQFFARKNRITKFPTFFKCSKLKDIDLSYNQIREIEDSSFKNLISLVNFNLRDNKLVTLSQNIKNSKNLERLDLSNNDLAGLPSELAELEYLKQLLINGNPLRTIRRDIINRGTDAILKHLKNQIKAIESDEIENSEEMILKSEIIKSSKIFDLSFKKISIITPNIINFCKQSTASVLNVMRNSLTDLPVELAQLSHQLNELNISFNLFTVFPKSATKLMNLTYLDLRSNKISDLPIEFIELKALRELILSDNKFQQIPECIYQLPILENLFANNNQIKFIDGNKIVEMKFLALLNLQNNDIGSVPLELGKANQIKSLKLEGNPFKIPRSQILAKGTAEILNYLRGRLNESSNS